MKINLTYDASVSGAPAGFTQTAQSVVDFFGVRFTVPIQVGLQIGWGTLVDSGLPANIVGASLASATSTTFSALRTALTANAISSNALAFVASIQGSDPSAGGSAVTSLANAMILGLKPPSSGVTGFCGIGSSKSWTFNTASGGALNVGTFDAWGTMAHEFSELLGRFRNGAAQGGTYYPLDLMSYTAAATRAWAGTTSGSYCSVNGGTTNLEFFNISASGDFGDYAGAHADCGNAFTSTDVSQPWTTVDDLVMDAMGYQLTTNPKNLAFSKGGLRGRF